MDGLHIDVHTYIYLLYTLIPVYFDTFIASYLYTFIPLYLYMYTRIYLYTLIPLYVYTLGIPALLVLGNMLGWNIRGQRSAYTLVRL